MAKEVFDFKNIEVSSEENNSYLQPGMYILSAKSAKFVKPEGKKTDGSPKTSYLEITFGGDMGQITHKYFITPKALERLQTIYTVWFDKKCEKAFDSMEAIGAFFELAFNSEKAKQVSKRMIISGRQVGDKVYGDIPFSRYIVDDNAEWFKEGPFAKDSADWAFHVKVEKGNVSSTTDDVMIPVDNSPTSKVQSSFEDDLPF